MVLPGLQTVQFLHRNNVYYQSSTNFIKGVR